MTDFAATRLFANGDGILDGIVVVSTKDGSRVITIGGQSGNVNMPNDCVAKRFFANGDGTIDGTVRVSTKDGSRVITIGDQFGNVIMPNDCSAKRFFADDVFLSNADCAEEFDIASYDFAEPGTVMVLNHEGTLHQSEQAYDKKVAGVISGAGGYKPGIVLDKQEAEGKRMPIALVGKVYCKVDAQYSFIEIGDLLTTSPTPGHAMKADDPLRAFGAVIGKALRPLTAGKGLVPILIALQ